MGNPTSGDSIKLRVINFTEANEKINAFQSMEAILHMGVRDQLRDKKTPHIAIPVKSRETNSIEK